MCGATGPTNESALKENYETGATHQKDWDFSQVWLPHDKPNRELIDNQLKISISFKKTNIEKKTIRRINNVL